MKTTLVPVAAILAGVVCLTMALAVEPEARRGAKRGTPRPPRQASKRSASGFLIAKES